MLYVEKWMNCAFHPYLSFPLYTIIHVVLTVSHSFKAYNIDHKIKKKMCDNQETVIDGKNTLLHI